MPTITIRGEDGGVVEREVVSRNALIAEFADDPEEGTDDLDPILEPAVPQRVEWDDEGEMSSITTVCGETENRRNADKGARMVLEGIITDSQLQDAKEIRRGDNLTLVSDVHSGPIEVRRVTIEQNSDLIEFTPDGGTSDLAYKFQMQFRSPTS